MTDPGAHQFASKQPLVLWTSPGDRDSVKSMVGDTY
jgi:hypothetical protein